MKERPILFSGPMVRAILDGQKTQTRRIVKPQPADDVAPCVMPNPECQGWQSSLRHKFGPTTLHMCPYGQPGDRLFVREAWSIDPHPGPNYSGGLRSPDGGEVMYRATDGWHGPWRPSIYMPRWASRITLEITGVRVERLNDINEADAIAEGVTAVSSGGVTLFTTTGVNCFQTAKDAYAALWESINGPGSWDANPWVWVVEFRRVEK